MPHIPQLADLVVEDTTPEVLNGHDVIILATAARGLRGACRAARPGRRRHRPGADHRLEERSAWDAYYGGDFYEHWGVRHARAHRRQGRRGRVRPAARRASGSRRIAGPGCNVTAVTLALQPAVAEGLVETTDIVADLVVGYSGAGKNLKRANLLASEAFGSAVPYSVGGTHRHIPEILQNLAHAAGLTAADADRFTLGFTRSWPRCRAASWPRSPPV